MTETIGLFGGTFSPIHFGHLNLAVSLMEQANLSQVWFSPANTNPHKNGGDTIAVHHRLAMVELAIADNPKFRVIDLESKRPGPSYTIDTIKQLKEQYPLIQFRLILSNDVLASFYQWRDPEEIIRLAPPLVGQRCREPGLEASQGSPAIRQALQAGWIETPLFEVSSTLVRDRLHKGLYCSHLVPSKVLDYIAIHHLY